jgi:ppGpp synthetase/RelA/SpoT-type nucleotidyltranferase
VNLEEYEKEYRPTYEALANVVRFILEQAIAADPSVPRPQSVQSRAKQVDSLRRRLEETNNLQTQTLEADRRDLAGARLVFYTNNDVERFLASRLVRDNFAIEEDSTKVHHPTPENEGTRYRAIHYTVQLTENRVQLPEYSRFSGLRCEIQVQTILNHAWSETSHDIIYKESLCTGFGQRAMEGIKRRFERIMDRYLIPAGYEIQKAQQDYEHVRQGKALFDQDIVQLLDRAQNNNDRYEILSGLKDYALPYYDDLPTAYSQLRPAFLRAVQAARVTARAPITTTFGQMRGVDSEMITRLVVEIVSNLRYADVVGTLQLLIDLYGEETNTRLRQQIVNVAKHLAEYDIDVYQQIGPNLQLSLLDYLSGLGASDIDAAWEVALAVWSECLRSDISASKWTADSVILRHGAVPASDLLRAVRDKAIASLFSAFDRSTDDARRIAVYDALDAATATPFQGNYSNALLRLTLEDSKRIVDAFLGRAGDMSHPVLQHLEHRFHHDYQRAQQLMDDPDNRFEARAEARALGAAILQFRDRVNVDEAFVRYKVLVGFESVYPPHWEAGREFDFNAEDEYRRSQATQYLQEINPENEAEWFSLISRCAETPSQDLMTFRIFTEFLSQMACQRPDLAERLLRSAQDPIYQFLAAFLNGLERSNRHDIYERIISGALNSARDLPGLARHLHSSNVPHPGLASRVLSRSIHAAAVPAVIECLTLAIQRLGTDLIDDPDRYVQDALQFLNDRKDVRWVQAAWFIKTAGPFYDGLTGPATALLLANLTFLRRIEFHAEAILGHIAARHLEAVWDYFGVRLARKAKEDSDSEPGYEPIPFRFFGLEKQLSRDPQLALSTGFSWFRQDDPALFEFRGGRLLSNAFPNCTPEFASALLQLIQAGGDQEARFALAILQNYKGAAVIDPLLREIVARFPDDERKMSAVSASIISTGVVSGEYGFAEAWRNRRQSLIEWLSDNRPSVVEFAKRLIAKLDLMIADEHRRAESSREMFVREFEQSHEGASSPTDEPGENQPKDGR